MSLQGSQVNCIVYLVMNVPAKQRRRRLGGEVVSVQVPIQKAELQRIDAFRKEFKASTGKPLTKAFIFREGSKLMIRQLRVYLTKAKKGRLHAKIRESGN